MSFYECQDRCRQFWPLLRNAISSLLLLTLETASVHMWMCQDADVNLPTPENGKQEHDVSIYIYIVHVVSLSSPCIPMLKLTETLVLLLKGEGIAAIAWRGVL